MEILSTIKLTLTWLWVYRAEENTFWLLKLAHALFGFTVFATVASMTMGSMIFFARFASVDLEQSLYALFQISAFLGLSYVLIVAYLLRNEVTDIVKSLDDIYDASMI